MAKQAQPKPADSFSCTRRTLSQPCDSTECEYYRETCEMNCYRITSLAPKSRAGYSYPEIGKMMGEHTDQVEELVAGGLETMKTQIIAMSAAQAG